MKPALRTIAAVLLLAAAGCATAGPHGAVDRDRNEITEAEIRGTTRSNAFELIQALRSDWLRQRATTAPLRRAGVAHAAPDDIIAYLDGQRLGTVEALRSVSVQDIRKLRRYSAGSAQQRWGNGHNNGAIEVTSRSGGSE